MFDDLLIYYELHFKIVFVLKILTHSPEETSNKRSGNDTFEQYI